MIKPPNLKENWRFYLKWIGLGFIIAGAIGQIYIGFNYTVLGLYVLGILLFLSWYLPNKQWRK